MSRMFKKELDSIPDQNTKKFWTPANSDSYQLKIHEQQVYATIGNGVTCTLKLPNVVEAEGLVYSIFAVDGTGSCTVTAYGAKDWSDLTVDTTNDAVVLKAMGGKWWAIDNEIS